VIDTFHFFRGRSTWEELESVPFDALGYVHFDDALAPSDDVLSDTNDRRAFPGEGVFDLTRFVRTLTRRGWSGVVSIEVKSEKERLLGLGEFARRAYRTAAPYWGLDPRPL
jgi:sugar phosphate isomerase/epimerase